MKEITLAGFDLKKPLQISRYYTVLRALLNLCHRPAVRFGRRRDPRGRFRDPQFASFMTQINRKQLDTDRHDAVLRGRRVIRNLFRSAIAGGCAWVLLESARALSVF